MASTIKSTDAEKTRIMLGLLESVERGDLHSQRRLASELGIALGLVNAYLKRCVAKGLVKVGEAPARRFAYYLTPQGFAEKSRLTIEYLSFSFSLFRQAKTDCIAVFQSALARELKQIAFVGVSDLAEIAAICALDCGVSNVAVVDAGYDLARFAGMPVVGSFGDLGNRVDAVLITDMNDPLAQTNAAISYFGAARVLVPALLDARASKYNGDSR